MKKTVTIWHLLIDTDRPDRKNGDGIVVAVHSTEAEAHKNMDSGPAHRLAKELGGVILVMEMVTLNCLYADSAN